MALDALRGVAQGIAGRAFKKVAGNIRSGLLGTDKGGSDGSDPNLLNTFGTKFQTTQLKAIAVGGYSPPTYYANTEEWTVPESISNLTITD